MDSSAERVLGRMRDSSGGEEKETKPGHQRSITGRIIRDGKRGKVEAGEDCLEKRFP